MRLTLYKSAGDLHHPSVEPSPLSVCGLSAATAETSSNWIKEVAPPRGFSKTLPLQLTAPPKPHTGVSSAKWVPLAEQCLDSRWWQLILVSGVAGLLRQLKAQHLWIAC